MYGFNVRYILNKEPTNPFYHHQPLLFYITIGPTFMCQQHHKCDPLETKHGVWILTDLSLSTCCEAGWHWASARPSPGSHSLPKLRTEDAGRRRTLVSASRRHQPPASHTHWVAHSAGPGHWPSFTPAMWAVSRLESTILGLLFT